MFRSTIGFALFISMLWIRSPMTLADEMKINHELTNAFRVDLDVTVEPWTSRPSNDSLAGLKEMLRAMIPKMREKFGDDNKGNGFTLAFQKDTILLIEESDVDAMIDAFYKINITDKTVMDAAAAVVHNKDRRLAKGYRPKEIVDFLVLPETSSEGTPSERADRYFKHAEKEIKVGPVGDRGERKRDIHIVINGFDGNKTMAYAKVNFLNETWKIDRFGNFSATADEFALKIFNSVVEILTKVCRCNFTGTGQCYYRSHVKEKTNCAMDKRYCAEVWKCDPSIKEKESPARRICGFADKDTKEVSIPIRCNDMTHCDEACQKFVTECNATCSESGFEWDILKFDDAKTRCCDNVSIELNPRPCPRKNDAECHKPTEAPHTPKKKPTTTHHDPDGPNVKLIVGIVVLVVGVILIIVIGAFIGIIVMKRRGTLAARAALSKSSSKKSSVGKKGESGKSMMEKMMVKK